MANGYLGVGSTAHKVKSMYVGVGGVARKVKKAYIGVNGAARLWYQAGTPLSDYAVGSIVKINESGSPVDFYVAKHDYESGLNGTGRTLLVRKNCYAGIAIGGENSDRFNYSTSTLDTWYNSTYLAMLDTRIRSLIGTTTFYHCTTTYLTSIESVRINSKTSMSRGIFSLSATELGLNTIDGTTLTIASTLCKTNAEQWTRTPTGAGSASVSVVTVTTAGKASSRSTNSTNPYSRPAFTLPDTVLIDSDGNILT